MLKSLTQSGWAVLVPLFGLGCECLQRNCCSPCPCAPITSTCSVKTFSYCCDWMAPCVRPTCCNNCGQRASEGRQCEPTIRDRIARALRRSSDGPCSAGCGSCEGCGGSPSIIASPSTSPFPASSPAGNAQPAKTTRHRKAEPLGVTESLKMPCNGCESCRPTAAMRVPGVNSTVRRRPGPTFIPVVIADDLFPAVVTEPVSISRSSFHGISQARAASYSRNEDYTSLVGQLLYEPRDDTWRLRFAPVNVADVFGGSVTLVDVGDMMRGLRPGQMVAVEGEVVDLEPPSVGPAYRIRSIRPVNQ